MYFFGWRVVQPADLENDFLRVLTFYHSNVERIMGTLLKVFGGIILMILGIFMFRSAIGLLFQGPIGFIIGIALIAGGITLFIKGWR